MTTQTLILPGKNLSKSFGSSALQILAASLFLALCAQISIPLYFTPVPLSAQTLGILFIGVILGPRKGALAVMAYIAEGCMGLPVFAGGSSGGLCLLGPTGGYFLGFIVQAYLAGWTVKRFASSTTKTVLALSFACASCLTIGTLWLCSFVGLQAALTLGFYPFLIGEAVKVLCVTMYLKSQHATETNPDLLR